MSSSEEILRAIEELRRNQALFNDSDNDLDIPCPPTTTSQEHHPADLPPQEQCVQEVKRYKLKAPLIACRTDLLALPKQRFTADTAKATPTSTARKHASPTTRRAKNAPKRRDSPRDLPAGPAAYASLAAELEKARMAKTAPTDNSTVSDASGSTARETPAASIPSQASSFLSTSECPESLQSPSPDNTSIESSNVDDKVLYDRGTFLEDKSPTISSEKYFSAQSSPYTHDTRQPKSPAASKTSSLAKASNARVTVSLAGCWKKPSVTQMSIAPKEVTVAPKEVAVLPKDIPVKCRVSPSDVRSVLEKLEREVSATLRQDKAGNTYSQLNGEPEQEFRTLVHLTDSLPSILGDQDSYASLSNIEEDETDNDMISLYNRGLNFERKQREDLSLQSGKPGKISWRKKPSSYDNRRFQSDVDERPMNGEEWKAKRTNSLLTEATALLQEHRRSVAETANDLQVTLPASRNVDKVKGYR